MKLKPESDFLIVPNKLLKSAIRILNDSELKLLLALLYISQRLSTDKFYRSDRKIISEFKISQSSITRARPTLRKLRLIDYKSGFSLKSHYRATTYWMIPSNRLRKKYRLPIQTDKLSKPP